MIYSSANDDSDSLKLFQQLIETGKEMGDVGATSDNRRIWACKFYVYSVDFTPIFCSSKLLNVQFSAKIYWNFKICIRL